MILPLFDEWYVRSYLPTDAESIATYANNRHVSINLRDSFPYPYTVFDAHRWLQRVQRQQPEVSWGIASAKEVIGGIGIHPQHDVYRLSAEIGYWLGEPFWRKGIATAAVKAVTTYVFEHFDFLRLYAGVFAWNPASARVLEKAGFSLEARMRLAVVKDGQVVDQLMYVLLRDEWQRRAR